MKIQLNNLSVEATQIGPLTHEVTFTNTEKGLSFKDELVGELNSENDFWEYIGIIVNLICDFERNNITVLSDNLLEDLNFFSDFNSSFAGYLIYDRVIKLKNRFNEIGIDCIKLSKDIYKHLDPEGFTESEILQGK